MERGYGGGSKVVPIPILKDLAEGKSACEQNQF